MASAATTTTTPAQQQLPARRSQHVAVDMSQSDGDTWHERIAVCESATVEGKPQLLVRSYYRNARTHERTWDEPPSGASHIKHATEEMREKADLRMQELQLTLEMIPDDITDTNAAGGSSNTTSSGGDSEKGNKKTKKKGGGLFGRFRNPASKKEKKYLPPDKDLNLQKAIARSMADQSAAAASATSAAAADGNHPVVYYDGAAGGSNDDDDLAMAKALSMSEHHQQQQQPTLSEEEMVRKALEASRKEARRAAKRAPLPDPGPMHWSPLMERETFQPPADDDELDCKMPARAL